VNEKIGIILPVKQKVWGWPTIVNFFLGGMGASYYLLNILISLLHGGMDRVSHPAVFKLLAPALVGSGFLSLTVKAGRPLRGLQLFLNIRSSWISREVLAGSIFITASVLDWFFSRPILSMLSISAAMALLVSQSFIIYRARAITAWNVPLMVFLNLTSGLATGCGLVLLMTVFNNFELKHTTLRIILSFLVLDTLIWLLYLFSSRDVAFRRATELLRRPILMVTVVVLGRLFPLMVMLLLLLLSDAVLVSTSLPVLQALVGLAVLAGGASQKYGIILVAGYSRGFLLNQQCESNQKTSRSHPVPFGVR
jgi:DMSO reductase anchor subunit